MTILEFAHHINRLTGNGAGIGHEPLPQDDPAVRQPDITRAREKLGWEPKVTLEDGLEETIRYFRSRMSG